MTRPPSRLYASFGTVADATPLTVIPPMIDVNVEWRKIPRSARRSS
jgi:hypothetical protein